MKETGMKLRVHTSTRVRPQEIRLAASTLAEHEASFYECWEVNLPGENTNTCTYLRGVCDRDIKEGDVLVHPWVMKVLGGCGGELDATLVKESAPDLEHVHIELFPRGSFHTLPSTEPRVTETQKAQLRGLVVKSGSVVSLPHHGRIYHGCVTSLGAPCSTQLGTIGANTRITISLREQEISMVTRLAGREKEEKELMSVIYGVLHPSTTFGVKGVLVHGPHGSGKSTLVRHVTNNYPGIRTFHLTANQLIHQSNPPGQPSNHNAASTSLVAQVFAKAIAQSPAIVCIDDLDLIGNSDISRQVVKNIADALAHLPPDSRVALIGIATVPSSVPSTLMGAGKLEHQMRLNLPTRKQREAMLASEFSTLSIPLDWDQGHSPFSDISHMTGGYSYTDLKRLVRRVAINAVAKNNPNAPSHNVEHEKSISKSNESAPNDNGIKDVETHASDATCTCVESRAGCVSKVKKDVDNRICHSDIIEALALVQPTSSSGVHNVEFTRGVASGSVGLDRVAGYKDVIGRLEELMLWPMKHAESYARLGVSTPSGLLLYGPTGCGKTLLVNAMATTHHLNIINIKATELFSKYLGETEATVRQLFATARETAPCIVFLDEVDALAVNRGDDEDSTGSSQRVLSQMLNEIDGIQGSAGVLVVGCTNGPLSELDPAMLRPGRLEGKVYVGHPRRKDRQGFVSLLTRQIPLDVSCDHAWVVERTKGLSGAGIVGMFRKASLSAVRRDTAHPCISREDIENAMGLH
eukprot:comp21438_c0_seq1/m.29580 comp21438_c0_seq1/g.29580  ORF comp21438_c0_seq1/g.29580 comp21438_c0_seq1/m.29580 type:complete len:751 (-) comp21438_c0_seq1:314-2566(-)